MKKLLALPAIILLSIATVNLQAQNRFSVTLQAGYGTGAYEAAKSGISYGKLALRLNVSYEVLPILDAYAGYSRTGFRCGIEEQLRPGEPRPFCAEAPVDFNSSGFNLGLRLNRREDMSVWIPWLRAGLVYKTLEYSQEEGEEYSGSGLGFEIGAGLAYPVTEHIAIVPSINYTRYTIEGANGDSNPVVVIMGLIGASYSF